MRRTRLVAVGGVMLALGVSACGGGSSDSGSTVSLTSTKDETAQQCVDTPVKGGDLVYARQVETQGLNPIAIKNGNGDIFADEMIYNGLVRLDPEGGPRLQPAVADRWEISPDGKTYTFHIRPGIKFSDGTPVTAEDVKFSIDRFGDPDVNQVMGVLGVGYKSSRVVDDETVEIKLDAPVAAFLYNIAVFPAFIVPKAQVEKQGDAFWKHPVGTGPFRVKEFLRGSHITFEKNPHYWEDGKPYLDSVRFDFATDSNSRVLSLKSGEAQIADGIPFSQITALQGDRDLVVQPVAVPAWIGMSLNHKRAPLADLNVRQAMQHALDRDAINDGILRGVGTIPNSILPRLVYDASDGEVAPYDFDVAKAKALMARSKFPDGFSVTLQYPSGFDYYKQLTLLIQQQLAAIGIKVKLVEQDAATVADRFNAGDYDLTFPYPQLSSDVSVPDEFAAFYADPANGTHGFYSNWSDPRIAQLVKEFTTTPDEAKRAALWPQIQRAFMEQTPVINIIDVPFVNAHETKVCGTTVNALGADHLENTWLAAPSS